MLPAMPRAADLFVQCLENEGVRYVFGIPGEETLDLNDALDASPQISFIPVRHEQGARLHGRRLRPADRPGRRLPRHARARARPTS